MLSRFTAALLICVLLAAAPAPAQTVRVLINDAPPYRIVGSANGAPSYSGIYIDVLRAMVTDLGLTLDFIELPFARAFRVMQEGEADIMLGPNRSAEREAYMQYLDPPLPQEPKVFLQTLGARPIRSYDDLKGRRIAVLRGASYFDRFDSDATLTKIPLDDYVAAFRLVLVGRAEAVIIPEMQALWMLRQTGFQLSVSYFRAPGRDSYIVLSRRSPLVNRTAELEAALRRVFASGAVNRILQRYE